MEIIYLANCDSTQTRLIEALKNSELEAPVILTAASQSAGYGSRANLWESEEGNLYFSFALKQDMLPDDLPLSAISIYFAYLMTQVLRSLGSKAWLKWPNDFYLEQKIGGILSTKFRDFVVCGIGINIAKAPIYAQTLDIDIEPMTLLSHFEKSLKNLPKWKEILSKFLLEFEKSKKFSVHIDGKATPLRDASLADDGAIIINNKKVYLAR